MLSGMTRRSFEIWDPSRAGPDEPVPDYKLPLDDVVLWRGVIGAGLLGLMLTAISVAMVIFEVYRFLPSPFNVLLPLLVTGFSLLIGPYLAFRQWWVWRYLPLKGKCDTGRLIISQEVPKRLQWLLLLSSSDDDTILLGNLNLETPQRRPWHPAALFEYNTLEIDEQQITKRKFTLNPTGGHPETSEVTESRKIRYIQNIAHLRAIQEQYLERTGTGQADTLEEMLVELRQINANNAAGVGTVTMSQEQFDALMAGIANITQGGQPVSPQSPVAPLPLSPPTPRMHDEE